MRADIETVASFFIDLSRRISSSSRIDRAVTPTLARSGAGKLTPSRIAASPACRRPGTRPTRAPGLAKAPAWGWGVLIAAGILLILGVLAVAPALGARARLLTGRGELENASRAAAVGGPRSGVRRVRPSGGGLRRGGYAGARSCASRGRSAAGRSFDAVVALADAGRLARPRPARTSRTGSSSFPTGSPTSRRPTEPSPWNRSRRSIPRSATREPSSRPPSPA